MAFSYFISDISMISFHTYPPEDHSVLSLYNSPYSNYIKVAPLSLKDTLNTHTSQWILSKEFYFMFCPISYLLGLIHMPEGFWVASPQSFIFVRLHRSPEYSPRSNFDCWLLVLDFYHNSLASFVGMTIFNLLCTCAAVIYPNQVPAALQATELTLWPIPSRLRI